MLDYKNYLIKTKIGKYKVKKMNLQKDIVSAIQKKDNGKLDGLDQVVKKLLDTGNIPMDQYEMLSQFIWIAYEGIEAEVVAATLEGPLVF